MAKRPDTTLEKTSETGATLVDQAGATQPAMGTAAAEVEAAEVQASAAEASPPQITASGQTVIVTALQPIRWRIGRAFVREPSSIPAQDLTDTDLRALLDDPLLSVQVVDAPY